ncbi:hypothetical protein F5Y07DRAFT_307811 [Xylaria sp. FL0933]|nr:hypothetical protein F5Y07DRAFT_307811 [Xylaria sp. FL0933]
MTDRRSQWREEFLPQKVQAPNPIEDALKLLYTVTRRKAQCDYQAPDDDAECPICLSSFSRKSEETTSPRDGDIDLEVGSGIPRAIMSITASVSRLTAPAKWKRRRALQPSVPAEPADNDILVIRRCGHAFHSRCLVAWFMKEKYDCPLCRVRYYKPPRARKHRQTEDVRVGIENLGIRF